MPLWKYEEKDVRDDVKLKLPEEWWLRVFLVTSGDTGKQYLVQIMGTEKTKTICMCNCNYGLCQIPLSVVGLGPCCKHAENLLLFLREKTGEKL